MLRSQTSCGIRLPLQSGSEQLRSLFIERIIGVAVSIERVKRIPVVSIQRQPEPDALWQVRIRDKVPSEGNQICIAVSDSSLRGTRFKTSPRNHLSRENLSKPRRPKWPLNLSGQHV